MKKAKRVIISGNVQGVFFRQFIKDSADKLNIKGFVRNLENGEVEAFIEGDNENVDKMIGVCKKGPKFSTIKEVNIFDEKYQGLKEFKILHI